MELVALLVLSVFAFFVGDRIRNNLTSENRLDLTAVAAFAIAIPASANILHETAALSIVFMIAGILFDGFINAHRRVHDHGEDHRSSDKAER